MLRTYASPADDRAQTCCRAGWHTDGETAGYGVAGHDHCASIEKNAGSDYYAWSYCVRCAVTQSQVQGRHKDQDACLREAAHWLRDFNCPGHLKRQDKPWKQWTMIGQ